MADLAKKYIMALDKLGKRGIMLAAALDARSGVLTFPLHAGLHGSAVRAGRQISS
jgi:hypothetical protein